MQHPTRTLIAAMATLATTTLANAQWGPVTTTSAPAPRSGAMFAFDAFGNRMLMFGGNGTNEFWSLAGGAWTQLTPAVLPGPRSRASMATNLLAAEILLYGGLAGGQFAVDETWLFNGQVWQQLTPPNSPLGLYRHGMAFDLTRSVTVLFGGRFNSWIPNEVKDETWEFANGDWTRVFPLGTPPGLVDMAMSHHLILDKVLLFGGSDSTGTARDETWAYDGTSWVQMNMTGPRPAARVGAKMVSILTTNTCVLSGGRDPVTQQIFNDTWEHDGVNWNQVNNVYGGMYPPRSDFAMAHDFGRNRLVTFGGVTANNGLLDDTWEYGAQFQPFGLGCAGTAGVPQISVVTPAVLGTTFSAQLANLPPATTYAAIVGGFSRTQSVLGNLPLLLTNYGMPGCRLYTSSEMIFVLQPAAGVASWSWQVPSLPSLIGEAFYLQGVVFDPGVNPVSATLSNAATMVVGN